MFNLTTKISVFTYFLRCKLDCITKKRALRNRKKKWPTFVKLLSIIERTIPSRFEYELSTKEYIFGTLKRFRKLAF